MRGTILDEAKKVINGARQDQYGNPEDSFTIIAEFWRTYIKGKFGVDIPLCNLDTALMMNLFKVARETKQNKRDNLVDGAGYLGIAGDLVEEMNQETKIGVVEGMLEPHTIHTHDGTVYGPIEPTLAEMQELHRLEAKAFIDGIDTREFVRHDDLIVPGYDPFDIRGGVENG